MNDYITPDPGSYYGGAGLAAHRERTYHETHGPVDADGITEKNTYCDTCPRQPGAPSQ